MIIKVSGETKFRRVKAAGYCLKRTLSEKVHSENQILQANDIFIAVPKQFVDGQLPPMKFAVMQIRLLYDFVS